MRRSSTLRLAWVFATLVALAVLPAGSAQAKQAPCQDWGFVRPAASTFRAVHIANITVAHILRPKPAPKGRAPAVVLLHGWPGTECKLWWLARLLAGKGFVTLVVHYEQRDAPDVEAAAVRAGFSAAVFLRSSDNPYSAITDSDNISIIGHSLGAHATGELQEFVRLRTIVALDNLRSFVKGDRSSGTSCGAKTPTGPITPVVPALSLGSETGCYGPDVDKLTGYKLWKAHGIPVIQATLRHSIHSGFTGEPSTDADHKRQMVHSAAYIVPWLNFWTNHRFGLYSKLVSQTPQGISIKQMLSPKRKQGYGSAAFMPAFGGWAGAPGCPNLRQCP